MLQALLKGNTIGLMYLNSVEVSSAKGKMHVKCNVTECLARNFTSQNGKPVEPTPYHHCSVLRRDHCTEPDNNYYKNPNVMSEEPVSCHWLEFDGEVKGIDLANTIRKGNIPLFRFHKADRLSNRPARLQLVEMSPLFKEPYAVFSHVWSDGFGSYNKKNEMSVCVLNMFANLLEKITLQRSGTQLPKPPLFWIDTLAVPAQDEYVTERVLAIGQIHSIYTHAQYTVVLDLSLMEATIGSGYSDPAMKITMSSWMSRMWTLQEAVLSKSLYFNFQNRIFSMDRLEELFAEEDAALQTCVPALTRLYYHGILGPKRHRLHDHFRKKEPWQPKSSFVAIVWKATQWRSTSHLIHETLALATMFKLEVGVFAILSRVNDETTEEYQEECDARMIHLLSLLAEKAPCPIPPGMIFLPGPKLPQKGYGWAPRTWLSSREVDPPDPLSINSPGTTRLLASEGLEVEFPGFLLHDLRDGRESSYGRVHPKLYFSTGSSLVEWYYIEPEDRENFPEPEILTGRELAIIASNLPTVDLKEIALFVAIKRFHGGIRYVETLKRVWISREEGQEVLIDWGNKFRKGMPEAMCAGERLPSNSKWCVDGPNHIHEEKLPVKRELVPWPEVTHPSNTKNSEFNFRRAFTSASQKMLGPFHGQPGSSKWGRFRTSK
jgi:hypothetical protein